MVLLSGCQGTREKPEKKWRERLTEGSVEKGRGDIIETCDSLGERVPGKAVNRCYRTEGSWRESHSSRERVMILLIQLSGVIALHVTRAQTSAITAINGVWVPALLLHVHAAELSFWYQHLNSSGCILLKSAPTRLCTAAFSMNIFDTRTFIFLIRLKTVTLKSNKWTRWPTKEGWKWKERGGVERRGEDETIGEEKRWDFSVCVCTGNVMNANCESY